MNKWYKQLLAEKTIAILVLGVIAVVAIWKVSDPVAIVTGCLGAIGGFTASEALNK